MLFMYLNSNRVVVLRGADCMSMYFLRDRFPRVFIVWTWILPSLIAHLFLLSHARLLGRYRTLLPTYFTSQQLQEYLSSVELGGQYERCSSED
jgi:hypothetical protein